MLISVLSSFLFYPPEGLVQVRRMTFLSRHSAALALLRSRWLCCYSFARMSSPGIRWQRYIARRVLQVLSCQCFLLCMASGSCAPSAGQTSLAERC